MSVNYSIGIVSVAAEIQTAVLAAVITEVGLYTLHMQVTEQLDGLTTNVGKHRHYDTKKLGVQAN